MLAGFSREEELLRIFRVSKIKRGNCVEFEPALEFWETAGRTLAVCDACVRIGSAFRLPYATPSIPSSWTRCPAQFWEISIILIFLQHYLSIVLQSIRLPFLLIVHFLSLSVFPSFYLSQIISCRREDFIRSLTFKSVGSSQPGVDFHVTSSQQTRGSNTNWYKWHFERFGRYTLDTHGLARVNVHTDDWKRAETVHILL